MPLLTAATYIFTAPTCTTTIICHLLVYMVVARYIPNFFDSTPIVFLIGFMSIIVQLPWLHSLSSFIQFSGKFPLSMDYGIFGMI
jgi:hypothetical protein